MKNEEKALKIYGILFVFLAIVDILMIAGNLILGDLASIWNAEIDGISTNILNTIAIAIFVIMGIVVLIKLYLGIRGIQQSNGIYNGKKHITIAKISMIFVILLILISIPEIKLETSSIVNLCDDLVTVAILVDYIRVSKKILNK